MSRERSFCVLPFMHLATHPNGRVTPCCESKLFAKDGTKDMYLGNYTIEEIRNNKEFNKLREDMMKGTLNSSCDFCYKREEAGLESKRIRENKKYKLDYSKVDELSKLPLQAVELRLGNVCNAKCVICHPGSSSKWNEDITPTITQLNEGYSKNIISNTWFRNDSFYEELLMHKSSITHLWFNGGEPLLIKEHLKFLNQLILSGDSHGIELEYHTNGTLITEKIIGIWRKFKFVKVTLSLDDIEDRFHYARFPLYFSEVEKGITLLKQHNIYYDIIPTINILNVFNSTQIYQYFVNKYDKQCQFNYLRFPKFQNISNIPEEFKLRIINESKLPTNLLNQLKFELYSQENQGLTKALNFYSTLDRQRSLEITDYLPEFKELIKYERSTRDII